MKFDTKLIQLLKNFASINAGILFKPGNVLSTISQTKTILARAKIEQTIPSEFAIYDLNRFLSTLSLFENPSIDIKDNEMVIKSGARKATYRFAAPEIIMAPPEKELKLPSAEVEFDLLGGDLQETIKALNVLGLPEIAVVGDGKNIMLQAIDSKNSSCDIYSTTVGETEDTFRMIFRAENLKMIPGSYKVLISSKGLSKFYNDDIEYYISVETSSTFG
jgi:hypothetical protein